MISSSYVSSAGEPNTDFLPEISLPCVHKTAKENEMTLNEFDAENPEPLSDIQSTVMSATSLTQYTDTIVYNKVQPSKKLYSTIRSYDSAEKIEISNFWEAEHVASDIIDENFQRKENFSNLKYTLGIIFFIISIIGFICCIIYGFCKSDFDNFIAYIACISFLVGAVGGILVAISGCNGLGIFLALIWALLCVIFGLFLKCLILKKAIDNFKNNFA